MTDMNAIPKPRKVRLRSITVVAISPSKYPQFCNDRDNPFSSQPDDVRIAEIDDICARILAQVMLEGKSAIEPNAKAA